MRRRDVLKAGALALALSKCRRDPPATFRVPDGIFPAERNPLYKVPERPLTEEALATSYNNYFEITDDKKRVKELAQDIDTDPWTVEISGLCNKPKTIALGALITELRQEERIYRHRCVEAWSMTIPWTGFALAALLRSVEPHANAKYVRFASRKKYYEGLTISEAMNELALCAVGMYGKPLLRQNGAPLRLVVPWKYGFKSAKAIVKIELVEERPRTFWNDLVPDEYDFSANVDPTRPHPRWSQTSERHIVDRLEGVRVLTQAYNGYAEQVAHLYQT